MVLLQVTNTYYPELQFGGPPRKIHALSLGLQKRGIDVRVLAFHSADRNCAERVKVEGVEVQYSKWKGRGLRQFPVSLSLVKEAVRAADIVHCYGIYNFLSPLACHYAHRLGRPYVLDPLGMYPPRARSIGFKKIYNTLLTHRMARGAARLIATSEAEAGDLAPLGPPEKIVVRRNGVDLEDFKKKPSGKDLRKSLGLPPKTRIVLYMGRISPVKNLEQLVSAFHLAKLPDTALALVGPCLEPDYEARVRGLIAAKNLGGSVFLPGPLYEDDKLAALLAADLFVLPSLNESYGNAAAEAVAAGIPALLTDTCGIAPQIHQRAGLAVPLGEESLANGLQTMFDPEQRRRLTAESARVGPELSWEGPLDSSCAIYESVLKEARPSPKPESPLTK